MVRLPDAEKILKICLLISIEFTNVTDGWTDGQTPYDGIVRTCIASHGKNHKMDQLYNQSLMQSTVRQGL